MQIKRIITLFFLVICTVSAYGQTPLQEGNTCFEKGDYTCAIAKYNEALKSATGAQKEIISINLKNAQKCADEERTADSAFNSKNYALAKQGYQNILDLNPKDTYAKARTEECNKLLIPSTKLTVSKADISFASSGGREGITVNTNAKSFSVTQLPAWCMVDKNPSSFFLVCTANTGTATRTDYFMVTAGDKTVRINVSQAGKNQTTNTITLSTSTQDLSFDANGGRTVIDVKTNASDYRIGLLPNWCKVEAKHPGWFSLVCDAHYSNQSRSNWFYIRAGGKEIRIDIRQSGTGGVTTQRTTSSSRNTIAVHRKHSKCFNCPKTENTWGLTAGYIQNPTAYMEGIQLGLRVEPLFKYGFGLTTGVNFEGYSVGELFSGDGFDQQVWNIPLHAQYRLNFSKWFNVFAYAGGGFNHISDELYGESETPISLEYGGGLRINKVQFNLGWSEYKSNLGNPYWGYNMYDNPSSKAVFRKVVYSVSYMF